MTAPNLAAPKLPALAPGEFRFVTKALQVEPSPEEGGKRRFKTIASSTILDSDGDEIKLSALQDMANAFQKGINIFTDHEHKVDNVFGRSDWAEIRDSGERDPKSGNPIFDLHVAGNVNEPNPRMKQLSDSMEGGYVTFGASIGARVKEHQRNKGGGMDIYHVDTKEASIVGIPSNQRSWTYKAAKAARALDAAAGEDILAEDDEPEVEKDDHAATPPIPDIPMDAIPTIGEALPGAPADPTELTTPVVEDDALTTTPDADGQESDKSETPETTDADDTEETDTPEAEKAAALVPADEVKELLAHVAGLVEEIGSLRAERDGLLSKVASYETQASALTDEVGLAKQVIEKVMAQPLRSQTAGYVHEFTKTHDLFAPEVAEYLTKRDRSNT